MAMRQYAVWDDEKISLLFRLKREGRTYREIGEDLGVSSDACHGAYKRYKDRSEAPGGMLMIDGIEGIDGKPLDIWTLAKNIIESNEICKAINNTKYEVDYKINVPEGIEWVGLVPFGDLHIDNVNSTPKAIMTSFEMMVNNPLIWTIGLGDYSDNVIAKKELGDMIAEMYMNPKLTSIVIIKLFEALADRLICLASGCHDRWTRSVLGFDFVETLCEKTGAQYIDNSGKLTLRIGDQTYSGLIGHRTQRGSNLNLTAGPRSALEDKMFDGDFSIWAHKHAATFQVVNRQPDYQDKVFMLVGGWKPFDSFSRKLGYPGSDRSTNCHPCVLFNAWHHELVPVRSVPMLVHMLEKLNAKPKIKKK
jgi:hypothetical protein